MLKVFLIVFFVTYRSCAHCSSQAVTASNPNKKAAADAKREAARELKAEKKQQAKDQKKILALANKVILLAKPVADRMENCEKKNVAKLDLSEVVVKSFTEKKAILDQWVKEAYEILKLAGQQKDYGWNLASFEDDKAITLHIRDCNKIMKEIATLKKAANSAKAA